MSSSDEEEGRVCPGCGAYPCEVEEFGDQLLDLWRLPAINLLEETSNSVNRKCLYRKFIYLKYGHLGCGNRIPISKCIRDVIRETYPQEDPDSYMGFKDKK